MADSVGNLIVQTSNISTSQTGRLLTMTGREMAYQASDVVCSSSGWGTLTPADIVHRREQLSIWQVQDSIQTIRHRDAGGAWVDDGVSVVDAFGQVLTTTTADG